MTELEAAANARILVDRARQLGHFPAGIVETTASMRRRRRKRNFIVVHGKRLDREIMKADQLVGLLDEHTTYDQVAGMLKEED